MLIINRRKTVLENNQTVELSVTDFRRYYSIILFANFMTLCYNKNLNGIFLILELEKMKIPLILSLTLEGTIPYLQILWHCAIIKKFEWIISNSQVRENEDSINIVKLRGSIKEKISTSLIIKSANLRLLDPIGQGWQQLTCVILMLIFSLFLL